MHGRLKVKTTAEQQEAKEKEREKKMKLYTSATARVFDKKQNKEYDQEALDLTGQLLSSNPDFYSLWNFRREILQFYKTSKTSEELQTTFDNELYFLEQCLKINHKSYGSWHHRSWAMENMSTPNWLRERKLCDKFLEYDERNFHCWDYRRFIIEHSDITTQQEFDFTSNKIISNFSNYSSWHYRSKLLPVLHPDPSHPVGVQEDFLLQEFELVQNAFFTDPNDQSAWFYHRWLLGRGCHSLSIKCILFNGKTNTIAVVLSKPIGIHTMSNFKLSLEINQDKITPVHWNTPSGEYSQIWKCSLDENKVTVTSSFDITVRLIQGDTDLISSLVLTVSDVDSECHTIVRQSKMFSQELSGATISILENELESCEQLHELEPDNKWTLLTIVSVMRALDPVRYEEPTKAYLDKLIKVDEMRTSYYKDLRSSFLIENYIENMKQENVNVDLSEMALTTLNHLEYLSYAKDVNLSNNRLSSINNGFLLHNTSVLNLSQNQLVSCSGLSGMQHLECLSLKDNNISDISNLDFLKSCLRLKKINIKGNPVCNLKNDLIEYCKVALPDVEMMC